MLVLIGAILFLASMHSADVYGLSANTVGGMLLGAAAAAWGLHVGRR